jgi:hypothetical protein
LFLSTAYGNHRVKFLTDNNKIVTPNPPAQVIDQCYDQGYGSERSPEDEMPPPLPILNAEQQFNPMIVNSVMVPQGYHDSTCQMLEMDAQQRLHQQAIQQNYDFIKEGELLRDHWAMLMSKRRLERKATIFGWKSTRSCMVFGSN